MAKAYVILTEDIKDRAGMATYARAAAPLLAKGGVCVLAVDRHPQVLEGDWHGSQTVVLEFPSLEAARAWYESPTYQAAKGLRQAAAETNAVIIAGLEAPETMM